MFNLLAFSSNHDAMSDDKKKEELFGVEFRRCSLQMTFIFSAREEKKEWKNNLRKNIFIYQAPFVNMLHNAEICKNWPKNFHTAASSH